MTTNLKWTFRSTEIGLIPNNWQLNKLSDLVLKITKGTTPTTMGRKFKDEGVNFVKVESLSDDGVISISKLSHIDSKTNDLLSRSKLQENDILYSIAGTIGRVALVTRDILPANTNQALAIIRPNLKKISLEYLKYALANPNTKKYLSSKVVHAVQPNLSLSEIGNCPIPTPSLLEQELIARVLSSLDKKIRLNRLINKKLEQAAELIFYQWFTNFNFPNEANKPYRLSGGKFQASTLGDIPKSWMASTVADVANISLGGTPKRAESAYWNGNILWATAGNIVDSTDLYIFDTEEKITKEALRNSNAKVLPEETIVVTARGTVGEMRLLGAPSSINQTCYALLPKQESDSYFLYFLLKSSLNQIKSLSYGTVFDTITLKTFDEFMVIRPPQEVIQAFNIFVKPLFYLIRLNTQQNISISKARDNLLTNLIFGKIRVPFQKDNGEYT